MKEIEMSYLKLLNAHRRNGSQPTMKARRFTRQQEAWAAEGICVKCGTAKAAAHSYICDGCQAEDTIEDIRNDIQALRRKILNKAGD